MLPRFWIAPPLVPGICELSDVEAHHLRNVLRLVAGETVELFDGAGRSAAGIISNVGKRSVQVQVEQVQETPQVQPGLTIATAIPKGERFDWIIEKATELGVSKLVPLRTARSTVDPRDSKIERLRQVVISACKQSRRNDGLVINPVTDWATFLQSIPPAQRWILAHPGGESLQAWISRRVDSAPCETPMLAAVGPEGGWSEAEVEDAVQLGAVPVALGPHILRIETAVLLLAATLRTSFSESNPGGIGESRNPTS